VIKRNNAIDLMDKKLKRQKH